MKKTIWLFVGMSLLICTANAQNTFPTSGNVGVNTSNPQEHLHVNGNQLINGGFLKFSNNSADANDGKIANSHFATGLNIVGINNDNTFRKIHLWGEITQQQNDGTNTFKGNTFFEDKVGIGTSTPGCKLHVAEGNIAASLNSLNGFVQLWGDNALIWKNGSNYNGLRFGAATSLTADNYSQKMILTDDGRLGIGTPTPNSPLDVSYTNNNYGVGINVTNTSTGTAVLSGYSISKASGDRVGQLVYVPNNYGNPAMQNSVQISTVGNTKMGFAASADASSTPDIYFSSGANAGLMYLVGSTGFVGIGTTTPSEKLSVYGTIKALKVKVTQTGWPDYVFEEKYALRTLDSLEAFVNLNKHLPDIQSATQIESEGLDIGENQAALLRKIEELTLYVIQMKKDYTAQLKKQELKINKLLKSIKDDDSQNK